jgi:endogenous inhibitor of DNA gyrase (YacG/DUF329 family)
MAEQDNPFKPFCSERCKIIDLGNWISETYRIPLKNADEDDGGETISQKPIPE